MAAGLKENPKFVYTIPTFQNPTGITYSLERRQKFIELINQNNAVVLEDNPYGYLRYSGEKEVSLFKLDYDLNNNDHCDLGNVIYTSTFSKILAPGAAHCMGSRPQTCHRKISNCQTRCRFAMLHHQPIRHLSISKIGHPRRTHPQHHQYL